MDKLPYRFTIILAVILTSCYLLFPTYKYYSLEKDEFEDLGTEEQKELKIKALSLGLDLTGGIKIILEADIPALLIQLSVKSTGQYLEGLDSAIEETIDVLKSSRRTTFFEEFEKIVDARKLKLDKYYEGYSESKSNKDILEELKNPLV